eukprot:TRINITY_DN22754_c0_g1_i1.p1 TRINITY_DN22754_c0_g1~~TRINITY_DN22754_c0_g1_i1.p1  ORF type:complete len:110 (+),score=10.16 TRINITY_DN22754_c0_g1_i1:160-489(+)
MPFGAPPSAKISAPSPPEKGSFPLDHFGECKEFMKSYMECLKTNTNASVNCRDQARRYLSCRMDAGLMAKEEFDRLGLTNEDDNTLRNLSQKTSSSNAEQNKPVSSSKT